MNGFMVHVCLLTSVNINTLYYITMFFTAIYYYSLLLYTSENKGGKSICIRISTVTSSYMVPV